MTQTAKAQEPSMEEILASIRRIIADDDAGKPGKAPEPAAPSKPAAAAPTAASARPATPPSAASPAPAPKTPMPATAANSQDEIDAMLAELDGPPKATQKPAASRPATPEVLDLTEAMAASATPPPAPAPNFRTIDAKSDVVFANKPEPQALPDRGLISHETVKAVDSAFNTLAHTLIGQNARTLEDLVREMLRPMLKSWLDDNLPGLVERIVRAEIERVSRGRP
jgi:cell pole-organizing protein PopZ